MIGVIVVALSCVAAAYLILKRYYAPGALLLVGCLTLCVAIFVGPGPLVAAKKATHCAGLDVIQTVTNLWRFMMRVPQVATYERFLLSLDLLYALGMIEMHEGTIRRT